MSGIHAVRYVETGGIKIEFLYPDYDLTEASNATIFPKSVLVNFPSSATIDPSSIRLEELRAYTIEQLRQYTGAVDCFQAAASFHAHTDEYGKSSGWSSVSASTATTLVTIGATVGFLAAVLVFCGMTCRRGQIKTQNYELASGQGRTGVELV